MSIPSSEEIKRKIAESLDEAEICILRREDEDIVKRKIAESLDLAEVYKLLKKNEDIVKKDTEENIPIAAIHEDTGRVKLFKSQSECSRVLGIHREHINDCLKGIRKSTGGYVIKKINRDKRVFKISPRSKEDINRYIRGIV